MCSRKCNQSCVTFSLCAICILSRKKTAKPLTLVKAFAVSAYKKKTILLLRFGRHINIHLAACWDGEGGSHFHRKLSYEINFVQLIYFSYLVHILRV